MGTGCLVTKQEIPKYQTNQTGSVQHQKDRQKIWNREIHTFLNRERPLLIHVLLAFSSSFCPELQLREECYFHLPGVFPPQSNSTQANSSSSFPEACDLSDSRSFHVTVNSNNHMMDKRVLTSLVSFCSYFFWLKLKEAVVSWPTLNLNFLLFLVLSR